MLAAYRSSHLHKNTRGTARITTTPLYDRAGVVKVEPRTARVEFPLIAIPEVAEKVRLPAAVRKERRVDFRIIEARQRAAVQSEGAGRDNQVAALQCSVAGCLRLAKSSIVDDP